MKYGWAIVVVACALGGASCQGGGSSRPPVDAGPPDIDGGDLLICNPVAQTGCNADEKCTWFVDQVTPNVAGHIACAPLTGAEVDLGEACTFGAAPMGFDNCLKGSVCTENECRVICDPFQPGIASGCDAEHSCKQFEGVFEIAGTIVSGGCDPACDPLTQAVGLDAACGSPDPVVPTRGCYSVDGFHSFQCAPVTTATIDRTDRVPAIINSSGAPFLNGCAPGFVPFFTESTGSMVVTCTGLCAPLEIDNTQPQNARGDATALAKLPREAAAVAGNATCEPGKKGSEAAQQCMFLWSFLADVNGDPGTSPFNETLGVCFAYTHFQIDVDADGTPETAFPACATLPPRSLATPGKFDDAADLGCQTIAHSQLALPTLRAFRLAYGPGDATAHVLR